MNKRAIRESSFIIFISGLDFVYERLKKILYLWRRFDITGVDGGPLDKSRKDTFNNSDRCTILWILTFLTLNI